MSNDFYYSISLPSNLEEGRKYPVIYAMHGRGSSENDIVSLLLALKEDYIIIGIRGALVLNSGFQYFTIKSIGNPDLDSLENAVESLEKFIAEVQAEYPIDPSRQFLFGFSQGAILAMVLSLKMGSNVKGIAALNGYIPKHYKEKFSGKSLDGTSVFIGHGERDQIFPISIGQENYDYFNEKTESVTYKVYPIGHSVSQEEKNDVVEWFRLRAKN
ncbi:MAG: esterase [Acidaminobacter sp.]|uniref:alpha/beta hydrolase n=1 Tax=Acidaminobacter sp. TaxID=1872102 RepID=UPI00137E341F|nr:alpha/beta hydrolase-fold protein [Acidaminobacter sp.]MZQ99667.1 esterase [Acidaminobacter sp.]